ncbi:hypothetical protein BP5796_07391 [Coleophoma crateriformis]|uniref:DUF7908 domain-containing protein n=1 Tax=Coleophoma crateriformis TaxID=565419 RepID=A0A3D8RIS2_9HELO|nr:hypothetical protein BP5796_07391 [Coleophoma crateriformis]
MRFSRIIPALCFAGAVDCYQIIRRQEACTPASGGIVQVYISTTVVTYPVHVSTYVAANKVININGGVTINVNNAPTMIDTTVTATGTETISSTITVVATATVTAFPFILLAEPALIAKRQISYLSGYVGANGQTTPNCAAAAVFSINEGQLYSRGEPVSTNPGVPYQPFAASPIIGEITQDFESYSGYLTWKNTAFYHDAASFCNYNGTVEAVFYGNMTSSCTPINLAVVPAAACVPALSSSSIPAIVTNTTTYNNFTALTSAPSNNFTASTSAPSSSLATPMTSFNLTISATTSLPSSSVV